MTVKTIRRAKREAKTLSSLSAEEKLKVLEAYASGTDVSQVAKELEVPEKDCHQYIQSTLKNMLIVRETNELIRNQHDSKSKHPDSINRLLSSDFLARVEDGMESYAFYFAETSDNQFALAQSGLDKGIPRTLGKDARMNVLKVRGQYLRSIPAVSKYIKERQARRIEELGIDKSFVQRELVEQIEQLKVIAQDDTKQRTNLLKSIELLGRSIGAFQDSLRVEEGNAKTGLDILMEKVKGEIYEAVPDEAE